MPTKIIFSVLWVGLVISSVTCKKKTPGCGCDSPITDTATTVVGGLTYDSSSGQYYIATYGIGSLVDNYICDTSFPGLQPIKDSARVGVVSVTFSGYSHDYCKRSDGAYIDQPVSFTLTQITKN